MDGLGGHVGAQVGDDLGVLGAKLGDELGVLGVAAGELGVRAAQLLQLGAQGDRVGDLAGADLRVQDGGGDAAEVDEVAQAQQHAAVRAQAGGQGVVALDAPDRVLGLFHQGGQGRAVQPLVAVQAAGQVCGGHGVLLRVAARSAAFAGAP